MKGKEICAGLLRVEEPLTLKGQEISKTLKG